VMLREVSFRCRKRRIASDLVFRSGKSRRKEEGGVKRLRNRERGGCGEKLVDPCGLFPTLCSAAGPDGRACRGVVIALPGTRNSAVGDPLDPAFGRTAFTSLPLLSGGLPRSGVSVAGEDRCGRRKRAQGHASQSKQPRLRRELDKSRFISA